MSAKEVSELQQLATENLELLLACGYKRPPCKITWDDRAVLVQSMTLHHVILECKGEIDQFADGLKFFNVFESIKVHPLLLKEFLCLKTGNVTPGKVLCMLFSV